MISVIIPNYNGAKYIKDCINSINKSTHRNFEIIVVNDNSTDKSQKILEELTDKYDFLTIINNKQNLGPSISRNKAAVFAKGQLLFFLDIDTQVKPDTLKNALKEFNENKKIGAAQAKLILGNTNKLDSAGHFLSPIGFPYEIGSNEPAERFNSKQKILGGKSAGLIIRKKVFEEIDGFDEDYFIYGEDTDLCWRVWLTGKEVSYLPSVIVNHHQKSSLNKETNYRVFYEGAKNNVSNLIKNLSFAKLIWLIPVHILAWLTLSLKQVITSRVKMAGWIYRGLWWNLVNLKTTIRKRKKNKIKKLKKEILFGQISYKNLVKKGFKWFLNV